MKYLKTIKDLFENINNNYKCVVCGEDLYITYDYGSKKTLQCSSDNAKFWNFPRGSKEQSESHEHFVKSTIYTTNNNLLSKSQTF